ncbi:nectin-1-like isoform X2 [Carcharodon carcharias]|uniref:nectin-1-like isoform X2 n=1 Tax=Carcharodon carcharias TaxID=13397 RepID=UPI001B7E3ECE|nr:nectin-1-like isoform X2 [Carcharodon carcharias]
MTSLAWISIACIALLLSATTSNHVTAVTLTALVGTEVLLPCQITQSNSNLTQIQWKKVTENKSFAVYNPKFGISVPDERYSSRVVFRNHSPLDGSILLKALEMEDQGMYICVINLFPQGIDKKVMNLTILAIPNNRAIPVPARTADSEVPVANCTSAYGNPAAEITWISGSHGNYTTTLIENNNGTATVISLYKMAPNDYDDGQTVTCIISHPASNSTDNYTIKLSILYPPEVTITGYDGNWSENTRDVTLNCEAKANPPATNYTWSRLPEGVEARNASVFIKEVSNLMNGTWTCEATNSFGTGKGKLEIILKDTTKERRVNTSQTQQDEQGIVYAALDLNVLARTAAQGEKEEPTLYADVKYTR